MRLQRVDHESSGALQERMALGTFYDVTGSNGVLIDSGMVCVISKLKCLGITQGRQGGLVSIVVHGGNTRREGALGLVTSEKTPVLFNRCLGFCLETWSDIVPVIKPVNAGRSSIPHLLGSLLPPLNAMQDALQGQRNRYLSPLLSYTGLD